MVLNCFYFTETREEELVPGLTDDTKLQRSNERRGGWKQHILMGRGSEY